MNRTEARALWARVAAGDLAHEQQDGVDIWAWIQQVAQQVLDADDEPVPSDRRSRLIEAIGLAGKEDRHAELKLLISDWCMFDDLTQPNQSQADKVEQLRLVAGRRGLLRGVYKDDPKEGRDLIRELLGKLL